VFTIGLDRASGRAASVHWATSDGTAASPPDYTSSSGNVAFTAGETTKTVSVPVAGDTAFEADETFTVTLSAAVAATIADGQGVGTIINDDPAPQPSPPPPPPISPPPPASPLPPPPPPPPAPTVRRTPKYALTSPARNAVVTAPLTLKWTKVKGATYYNVQVWRISAFGQAKAVKMGKILSAWPPGTSYRLRKTWKFEKETQTLTPGRYRWYVWPGLGKRSAKRYGNPVGASSFTVKAKAAKKAAAKKR
jgi:hypothetical protein